MRRQKMKDQAKSTEELTAAKHGNDINWKDKDGLRAIDYAWNGRDFENVLSLLKNDSVFPDGFDLNQNNDKDDWENLKKFVEERNRLHTYVRDGNSEKIRKCCSSTKSKFYLNSDNETLLLTAMKHKKSVIFYFLLSIGVEPLTEDEKCNAIEFEKKSVYENLKDFVTYFVKEFEAKLHFYHMVLEGEVKKAGKFSDAFSKLIGQGLGGAAGGALGQVLGATGVGAKLGAAGGEAIGEKVGSMIGSKLHRKKVITVKDLIDRFQNDKTDFRRQLTEDGFDIFQSYEMQFMKVTTDQGPKRAMQLLARDATNRLISHYEENKYVEGKNVIEGIVLGESKIEPKWGVPIPSAKIKKSGFPIDPIDSSEKQWTTAGLYEKVGLVKEEAYYEKKDGTSKVLKYGYRRFLNFEDWNKLKSEFKPFQFKTLFKSYQYILSSEDLERQNITKNFFDEINFNDKDLMEERIRELIEEVIEEIKTLKKQSHENREDLKVLAKIEVILKSFKVNEYLKKIEERFEEAKKEREEINTNVIQVKQEIKKVYDLSEKLLQKKQTEKPIWFDVKDPVYSFTGRDEELSDLHSKIQRNPEKSTVITHLTAISGLGGVGKTELARRYIQEHGKDFDNVLWINSESEATLKESFRKLANKLKIDTKCENGKEKDIKLVVEEVYTFLSERRSLFIFDNAEKDNDFIKLLKTFRLSLAPPYKKPHILITSRDQEWEEGIEIHNLNVLSLQDAADLVKKTIKAEDKEIKILVEKLQCFPLAIQQAIAYIKYEEKMGEYSISDYLEEFEKKTKDLLDSDVFKTTDNDYEKTTFTTWKITIDKIAADKNYGTLASDILNAISYLAPDNIKREMFLVFAKKDARNLKLAVCLLVKYSMINSEKKQSILSIHRLVQEVVRLELQHQNQEEKVLKEVFELLKENFLYHQSDKLEDYEKKRQSLPHLEALRSHIDQLIRRKPQKTSKIEKDFLENLLTWMSHAYNVLGDPRKQKESLGRILEIEESHYGPEHSEVARTLLNLSNAYGRLGDPTMQKKLSERALKIQEKHYESRHIEVPITLVNLGNDYTGLGDPTKQKELFEKALQFNVSYFGPEHFELAKTLVNLGNTSDSLGDPEKQKELIIKAFKIQEKQYEEGHFEVAGSLTNLGNAYGGLGDPRKQKELLERALKIQEKNYGSHHFEVARTLGNLGNVYGYLGDPRKQKELLERALKIQERYYGPEHLEMATILGSLGNAYGGLNDPHKQKELLERALKIQEKHYGPDHFEVAITLVNLGNAYGGLGDPRKQKELLERALKIQEKHYGPEHFEVARTLVNLGIAYYCLGAPIMQKELSETALKIQEKHYGSEHIEVAKTLINLSNAYCSVGDAKKQKELLERVLKIQEKHYGPEHFEVARTLVYLSNAYYNLGDFLKQQEFLERALKTLEKHCGSEHFEVATILENLGIVYGGFGDPHKQKELLEWTLAIKEKHYGPDHFEVARTLANLSNAYYNLGDPTMLKELSERALKIQEKHYGPDHFEVARTLLNLGIAYGGLGAPQMQMELSERALKIQEKHYGSEHLEVAITLVSLGNAYGGLGDHTKQKHLLERALNVQEKYYGTEHFHVAVTLVNLGIAYGCLGDPTKQKQLLERALKVQEKHYGSEHFEVAITLINLGDAYGGLRDPQKQKEVSEMALKILEKHYGSEYYQVAFALENLGNAYGYFGDPQKQKELLERALTIKEKHYGSEHFEVAITLANLGKAYGDLGDHQKQKKLLEGALTVQEKHYGSQHFEVARTLENLGNCYGNLGFPEKQKELLGRALKIKESHYGSEHFEVAITLVHLGNAYSGLGDTQKQKELLEWALKIRRNITDQRILKLLDQYQTWS